jgi:run domain Beclin-1 interacting cysteine-rich containing protein
MGTTTWTANLSYSSISEVNRFQYIPWSFLWFSRDSQLKKQGGLCAGCGRGVEKGYAHRFRYCEYTGRKISLIKFRIWIFLLGKYFCRSCHSDKKFYLPSYIITKWDFSNKHSVSNFAFDYLNRIYPEPIFNIYDLNSKLYQKSNKLKLMNELRWALYFLRYYILTCRFADEQGWKEFFVVF